ncbi:hypothetical protein [Actinoplanes sp. NPDC020271]|uniref:hypothetical protein n=1 Tax=Actinoplanes sp. NPDC020271 TaxID=3363896 RepID=UPI0037A26EDF
MRALFGAALAAGALLALGACDAGTATPAAATHPAAAGSSPATAPAPTHVTSSPQRAGGIADGKSQAFLMSIDVSKRVARIQPMKMVSCVGKADCTNDYDTVNLGGVTELPIAAGATFTTAMNDDDEVCDPGAEDPSCARTLAQFAAKEKGQEPKVTLTVRGGAAVAIDEIFTP